MGQINIEVTHLNFSYEKENHINGQYFSMYARVMLLR